MLITNKITVDLLNRSVPPVVDAVQADANTRSVEVTLMSGGLAWYPPSGYVVSVAYKKEADGTKGWYDKLSNGSSACTVSSNKVTATLADQVLTASGRVVVAIVFQKSSTLERLSVFPFELNVSENPAAGEKISNDYYNYSTMEEVSEAVEAFISEIQQTMDSYLEKAEEALEVIQEVVTGDAADAPAIVCSAEGKVIRVSDSSNRLLQNLRIFGKTSQNGTPSPTAPVALENVGTGGTVSVQISGKNLYSRGDKSMEQHATMELPVPLPPGTYTLSALVSSNDTDNTISRANFMHHNGSTFVAVGSVNLQRDVYNSGTVTIDEPCDAIRFHAGTNVTNSAGDSATWTNIMVEAGDTATAYEPYKGQTITVSTPNGLPGVPVSSGGNYTDETGQAWVCDEIDFAKGVYVQRIRQAVFDGSESWSLSSAQKAVSLSLSQKAVSGARGLCSHYVWGGSSFPRIAIYSVLNIYDESITTLEAWKERLVADPLTVFYQLAEPVETALSAEELAAYSAIYTHALHTTAINDAIANMELSYVADTKTYIDNKFTELQNAFLATGGNV